MRSSPYFLFYYKKWERKVPERRILPARAPVPLSDKTLPRIVGVLYFMIQISKKNLRKI
jgi:hypothetical protein